MLWRKEKSSLSSFVLLFGRVIVRSTTIYYHMISKWNLMNTFYENIFVLSTKSWYLFVVLILYFIHGQIMCTGNFYP